MKLAIALLALGMATTVQAQEPAARTSNFVRIASAVPRAWGRTVKNMVTFKDKQAAVEEWLTFCKTWRDILPHRQSRR